MIVRQKWTEHTFNLGLDPGWAPNILSRLRDAEVRIEHHCSAMSDEELSHKTGSSWSIKEHIGHLTDLEYLHSARLGEFADMKDELTAADMSNTKTERSNHNTKSLTHLINDFRSEREQFIKKFYSLPDICQRYEAMHPRLKVKMKPVDLLFFVAEHDDHHITSILQIKQEMIKPVK